MSTDDLKPFLATIQYIQNMSLLYYRVDASTKGVGKGVLNALYDTMGMSSPDPSVITHGIQDSCPQDLRDARDELEQLKHKVLTNTVDKTQLIPLHVSVKSNKIHLKSTINNKDVQLDIAVGDDVETLVPVINNEYYFEMGEMGPGPGPGVQLQKIKCKVIHIDNRGAEVLMELSKHTPKLSLPDPFRFKVPTDGSLYFWRHISRLSGFGFFKNNLRKQMTRRGGYTAATSSFGSKEKGSKKGMSRTRRSQK
jgi:hypothetical protein